VLAIYAITVRNGGRESKGMRIVVQNPKTGCYLQEAGAWTNDVRHARDFVSSADAMNARRQHLVPEASLVFRFEREGYSICIPLEPLVAIAPELHLKDSSRPRQEHDLLIG
jgi:hypothetical protein